VKIATGTVLDGRIIVDRRLFSDGEKVTVLGAEPERSAFLTTKSVCFSNRWPRHNGESWPAWTISSPSSTKRISGGRRQDAARVRADSR
jgi:hypothetical protein